MSGLTEIIPLTCIITTGPVSSFSPSWNSRVLMASWWAIFIAYQNVRLRFFSLQEQIFHSSQDKNTCFLGIFQDFLFLWFFFLIIFILSIYWAVEFYFHFHILYCFSLKLAWGFPLYFSEQLKKENGKFYDFLKEIYFLDMFFSSYFIFCIGFPWNLHEFFHYIFQNNSRKKRVSFMTFLKRFIS